MDVFRFRTLIPAALIALPIAALFGLISTFLANVMFFFVFCAAWGWLDSRPRQPPRPSRDEYIFIDD